MRESAADRLRGTTTRSLKQCSFCEKTQDRVGRLFSGVRDAFICDECVTYYHGALAELAKAEATAPVSPPKFGGMGGQGGKP